MLFDPESTMSLEQILEKAFHHHLPQSLKDEMEAMARDAGVSLEEVRMRAFQAGLKKMRDEPALVQQMCDEADRMEAPFGMDPRLRKDLAS